jgi:ABC-type bacteriocin/lantibiotic exporter with double-glycine peptidase domain
MSKRKEFDLHEQDILFSCGPGSLVMAYQGHGYNTTEELIRTEMQLPDDGATWWQLKQDMTRNGFEYVFKRVANYDELQQYQLPIVCYVTYRVKDPGFHFSVVYQIDDNSITVADPSFGDTYTYGRNEFIKEWHDEEGRRTFLAIVGQRSPSSLR